MAEDNVSKIKDRLDVVDVISGYLKLQKAGMNFKARCPFHNEKTPSFVVSPERQVWHCFGCGKGSDMFGFVQEIEGVEFIEALRILAQKAGIKLEYSSSNFAAKDDKAVLYEICETASRFFEKQLNSSSAGKRALEYLKNRGLTDETMKEFRLGFAPSEWESLSMFLRNCGYKDGDIVDAGLAIRRQLTTNNQQPTTGIYDRFRSRIMFPIFDLNGQVVGFTGRIFAVQDVRNDGNVGNDDVNNFIKRSDPTTRTSEAIQQLEQPKYINTPQTRIYDKGRILYGLHNAKTEIRREDKCVMVEGNMDVLMSYQAGVKNVVATSGTALTPGHLRIIQRYTTNLGLCFDTDQAGAMATRRGIGLVLANGLNVKVVEIPDKECKDPADYVRKYPSTSLGASWPEVVSKAKPVMEFYFDKAKAGFDPNSADSKKSVISVLAPFLKRLTSQVEKTHWLTQLAFFLRTKEEAIGVDVNAAKDDLEVYNRESSNSDRPLRSPSSFGINSSDEILSPAGRSDPLSETLLSLVMKNPILFKNDLKNINSELLDLYTAEAIVKLTATNSDNIADLLKNFREKNQSYKLEFAYLKSQELWNDSKDEDLKTEFNNLINKLEERHLRTKLEKIGFEMRAGDDKEKRMALAVEANKILNRLGEIQR